MKLVEIMISDVELKCPMCGAPEVDKTVLWKSEFGGPPYHPFWIKAYRVDNFHKCLWCESWWHDDGRVERGPHVGRIGPWTSQPKAAGE